MHLARLLSELYMQMNKGDVHCRDKISFANAVEYIIFRMKIRVRVADRKEYVDSMLHD